MKAVASFTVRPRLPEPLAPLDQLAANLRWSWHRDTREVFRSLDPTLWSDTGHDPRLVLAKVSSERLDELAADPGFVDRVADVAADLDRALGGPSWFSETGPGIDGVIAYFSPEFGIAEAVPQYSGGLGVLAGDHLKSSSDLGVPLVGIGLFYRHGYFRQALSVDGWQLERFHDLDPYGMSMNLCEGITVTIDLAGEPLHARVWEARVGRTPLYLLDSDVDENPDHLRTICDRLYGGDIEHRLRQEILLGIGGIRALDALGIHASVFHTNEGHAGFLGLERIRQLMMGHGLRFDEALEATRANAVFTTHTPVPAGIDRFPLELIERYFGSWAKDVGISLEELAAIGHRPGDTPDERFNMAVMGIRLAERRNGVAALHGIVSREMFADLWPNVPIEEVPIGSITNGVHGSTWTSPEIDRIYSDAAGPAWSYTITDQWDGLRSVDDERLWSAHRAGTTRLVEFCREQLFANGLQRGVSESELAWTAGALDPDALTICFARRFATYKRATLLLSQPDRLRRLLTEPDRPVQFIFAGKAHPADEPGKELIRAIVGFSHDSDIRHRFCFIDDYDMGISRHLLHGADVWLNTPLRPQEACGTSGMKAAMNGALNCSVLDGWWDECFRPGVGWAISSAESVTDIERRDDIEANSLFELLEQQIVPLFFDRPGPGAPSAGWVAQMRESMATVAPFVSSARMVGDYVTSLYGPAAASSDRLVTDDFAGARELAAWRRRVLDEWHNVHIDAVDVDESIADLSTARTVTARISLGSLDPDEVEAQVVSGLVGQSGELEGSTVTSMRPVGDVVDGHVTFATELLLDRAGRRGLTIRVVPRHALLNNPVEFGRVAWASD